MHPPVDRDRPPDEVADVFVHVEKETDSGVVVSGAKVVATNSALTHFNFIAHTGLPIKDKKFAIVATVPMNTPGNKLICRQSYSAAAALTGSPFDYPLSSRTTTWVEREVSEYLRRRRDDRPLFLVISFLHPHAPYDPPEPYASMYDPAASIPPANGYRPTDDFPPVVHVRTNETGPRPEAADAGG